MRQRAASRDQRSEKGRALTLLSALCLLLSSCRQSPTESPNAALPPPAPSYLNLMTGLMVSDRSGELYLQASALHAIDGMPNSVWTSPPGDPNQRLTVSFPTLTRITHLGLSTGQLPVKGRAVTQVSFESSANGSDFQPLTTVEVSGAGDDQLREIPPTDVLALRASIQKTIGNAGLSDLPELLIRGTELEPVVQPDLSGQWKLNNLTAHFQSLEGDRILGRIQMDPPLLIDGARNAGWIEFTWARGPQYGIGVLVPDHTGTKLNIVYWFQEAIPQFRADPLFGHRIGESPISLDPLAVAINLLGRKRPYPLYQLRFDGDNRLTPESMPAIAGLAELLARLPRSRFRMVAHDNSRSSAEDDLLATQQQLTSVREAMARGGIDVGRVDFLPAGRQFMRDDPKIPHHHRLHSRLELEVIENH